MTVKEVSKLSGVSVRTLHYYDEIGLLAPNSVTDAGYRLYDDTALARLSQILFFRELEFPLKEIKKILDSPGFDRNEALRQQVTLLRMKRDRLNSLIDLALEIELKGRNSMSFKEFDTTQIEAYTKEVKSRWGDSSVYREYQEKTKSFNEQDFKKAESHIMVQFAAFSKLTEKDIADDEVQAQVASLQKSITEHYYTCTKQILSSLGQMYSADERFRANIDQFGEGTADFASRAIAYYCK